MLYSVNIDLTTLITTGTYGLRLTITLANGNACVINIPLFTVSSCASATIAISIITLPNPTLATINYDISDGTLVTPFTFNVNINPVFCPATVFFQTFYTPFTITGSSNPYSFNI